MEKSLKKILILFKNGSIDLNNTIKYIDNFYNNINKKKINIDIYKHNSSTPTKVQLDLKLVANLLKGAKTLPVLNIDGLEGVNVEDLKKLITVVIRENIVGNIFEIKTEKGDIIKIYISF